jgi:xanthine dehydrogenase YagS FAD-binding subunit
VQRGARRYVALACTHDIPDIAGCRRPWPSNRDRRRGPDGRQTHMGPFTYTRVSVPAVAVSLLRDDPEAVLLAGGTEVVNWLKLGIARPARLLDITGLPGMAGIALDADGLQIGALVRMAELASHSGLRLEYPALAEALERSASQQLRNMATLGGNLLQRTRCPYFRSESPVPCNKRRPRSGCAAWEGIDRTHAIFGWSHHCLATHPSDVAVALAALDARVTLHGPDGVRDVPIRSFYRLPGETPERDTVMEHAELITRIIVPASPAARRSRYVKVRERTSYEFALVSAAAAVALDESGLICDARVALGGVAHGPWRLTTAERAMVGVHPSDHERLRVACGRDFAQARPRRGNGFKVELAKRAMVRAVQLAAEVGA